MKMVVSYLNFVFFIEVKAILNSEFRFSIYQKNEMALWVHGFTSTRIWKETKDPTRWFLKILFQYKRKNTASIYFFLLPFYE